MNENFSVIYQAILEGDMTGTDAAVRNALESGFDPGKILNEGMVAAMKEVGQRFEDGDYFVPEMLISARAMQSGLSILKPHLVSSNVKPIGKIVIGTVKGDLHDIGKNLVGLMLEGAGFEVKDLGTDVAPEKFISAVQEDQFDIICLSALLTTTMTNMQETIDSLKAAGLRGKVKVMIGGAPVTEAFAIQIGADGYSPDASSAARLARELVGA